MTKNEDLVEWLADPDCDRTTSEEKEAISELLREVRQLREWQEKRRRG